MSGRDEWHLPDRPPQPAAAHQYDPANPGHCTCGRWQHVGTQGAGADGGHIDQPPGRSEPSVSLEDAAADLELATELLPRIPRDEAELKDFRWAVAKALAGARADGASVQLQQLTEELHARAGTDG